jgi:hypothetical protein
MHQIRKTSVDIKGGPGGVGVYADKNNGNQVKFHDGSTERVVEQRVGGLQTTQTAAFTVALPADNGKIFPLALLASFIVTLPAVSAANKGMRVTFVNALATTSGTGYAISPNASDRIAYKADDADLVNTQATDALGDLVTLESDGVDGWIVVAKIGTWA